MKDMNYYTSIVKNNVTHETHMARVQSVCVSVAVGVARRQAAIETTTEVGQWEEVVTFKGIPPIINEEIELQEELEDEEEIRLNEEEAAFDNEDNFPAPAPEAGRVWSHYPAHDPNRPSEPEPRPNPCNEVILPGERESGLYNLCEEINLPEDKGDVVYHPAFGHLTLDDEE